MAETYSVYFGTDPAHLTRIATGLTSPSYIPPEPLAYATVYYWRVDATNENGTTTGDIWHFTTLAFHPPSEYVLNRRLIVAAKNSIFIEDSP